MNSNGVHGALKEIFIKIRIDDKTHKFIHIGEDDKIEAVLLIDETGSRMVITTTSSDDEELVNDFNMLKNDSKLIGTGNFLPLIVPIGPNNLN